MNNRRKSWFWLLRAELDMYYHFPWLEGIIGAFITLGSLITIGSYSRIRLKISLDDPLRHGPVKVDDYLQVLENSSMYSIFAAINAALVIIAFILPIILSFSLSESFQNGFIKTLLSYPITKFQILASKLSIAILLVSILAIIGCTLPVALIVPGPKDIESILLVSIALCISVLTISTTTVLVSVIVKTPLSTTVISSGGWILLMFLSALQPIGSFIRSALNPVMLVTDFISNVTPDLLLMDVIQILALWTLIGVTTFILSIMKFNRTEL